MSIIGSNILAGAAGSGVSAYEIEQSLRFNGSGPSRLTYDNTSGTNNSSSAWTLSFWMKRGSDVVTSQYGNDLHLMMWTPSGSCANTEYFLIADPQHGTTSIQNCMSFNGGGFSGNIANKLRDPSAWYHFVWRGNTGSSTNIIYINGEPVTAYNQGPSSMTASLVNGATRWSIGDSYTGCSSSPWDGYLAEVHFVDGQTLDHEDFGELDENGVWRPIEYTGTYGTNGYYLKFDPSATNGVGHDHSGNGHHWTASNVTTSGTGTDVMSDTPTNNFCTFNPLDKDTSTPTNGNLNQPMPGRAAGTIAVNSGKWYWEAQYNAGNGYGLGIGVADVDAYYPSEGFSNGILYYGSTPGDDAGAGIYNFGTTDFTYDGAWSGGRIGIALDLDSATKTITFYRDGTNKGAVTIPSGKHGKYLAPIVQGGSVSTTGSWDLRMQSALWTDSAPAGHKELCTSNLPAPDIADGSEYFNTVLWTGTGGSGQSITGVGFQPDLVWIKDRNVGYDHVLQDAVRGTGEDRKLYSSRTGGEADAYRVYGNVSSFDTDGFTVANGSSGDQHVNQNTYPYVGWNWLAGNGTSSNTAGSITSTVSANPTAGFSIVSYTGNNTAGATVGHGLGVTPALIITKNRDNGSAYWATYHHSLGTSKKLYLNHPQAPDTLSNWIGVSSTVITWNQTNANNVNENGSDFICYCFAEVEGYSKFGTYTGNGSSDGPFVFCGFRPAYVWLKGATFTSNWNTYDSARDQYNITDDLLRLNSAAAEVSDYGATAGIDLLSNGFKIRTSSADWNQNTSTFVFCAFAENPFGGSGISPATAR